VPEDLRFLWLGAERGYLSDLLTQRWVEYTGRRTDLDRAPWLEGTVGPTIGIGKGYFDDLARRQGLVVRRGQFAAGLIGDFCSLAGPRCDPTNVRPSVASFYE
jgi:hypothetical protein